jgi:hypothetical protein
MTPQVKTLLTHLQKHGSISAAEAATVYRIRSLPRRISDLKDEGFVITRELKKDPTGQRYARYTLVTTLKEVPKVGDRVEVVNPHLDFGDYSLGFKGTVTDFYEGDTDKLVVKFDNHSLSESIACVFVFAKEVKVITNA